MGKEQIARRLFKRTKKKQGKKALNEKEMVTLYMYNIITLFKSEDYIFFHIFFFDFF